MSGVVTQVPAGRSGMRATRARRRAEAAAQAETASRVILFPLALEPAAVRCKRRGGGPTAVMQAEWSDPDDVKPDAKKTARQVKGWMTYCPLRRMAEHRSSSITPQHIAAADLIRFSWELGKYGYSGEQSMMFIDSEFGSRIPNNGAAARIAAIRDYKRAVATWPDDDIRMLHYVVIGNHSVFAWVPYESERIGKRLNPDGETKRLVTLLGFLVKYYDTDIEHGMRSGRFPTVQMPA